MTTHKCEICKYTTNRKDDYNRHLGTKKHIKNNNQQKCRICDVIKSITDFSCLDEECILCKQEEQEKQDKHIRTCLVCKKVKNETEVDEFPRSANSARSWPILQDITNANVDH